MERNELARNSTYVQPEDDGMKSSLRRKFMMANLISTLITCMLLILLMLFTHKWWIGVLLSVAAAVISSVAVYMTVGQIVKPINALRRRIYDMAQRCDFTSPVPRFDSHDEIGELSQSLEKLQSVLQSHLEDTARVLDGFSRNELDVKLRCPFIGDFEGFKASLLGASESLGGSILQINKSASEISTASEHVAHVVQSVSASAIEQTQIVQELAQTVSVIVDKSRQNAQNAKQATDLSLEAGGSMMQGSARMQEMLAAMQEISEASKKIAKVIKTVDDIAFQTNILALNASVEAARAGAAGKGFAVVADEVRSLANRSAEASKGTSGLIQGALAAVETGTQIAQDTAVVFDEVMQRAKAATSLTEGLAKDITAQQDDLTRISDDIEHINDVAQTNSSTSQEGAAAGQQLSGQAQMLKDLVGRYHFKTASGILR